MSEHQQALKPRHQIIISAVLTLGLLLPLVGLGRLGAAPTADTIVRCQPEVILGEVGQPVSFTIFVQDVVDLYGADVQMAFDPAVAQVVDADPSKGGTQIEMLDEFLTLGFIVRDRADNVAGTIWYAGTQLNPTPAVSGSGALARVTLQSVAAGEFEIPITTFELGTRDGFVIPATAHDCHVTFLDPNALSKTYLPIALAQ